MKIKRVYLDLDGVLVDFPKGVHEAFDVPYDYEGSMRYDFWVDWHMDVSRSDVNSKCNKAFWKDLEWMQDGEEILNIVTKAYEAENVFFLTCPMPNAGSWTGKKLWVIYRAIEYINRLIVTHAPKTIFAAPDTLLIDDKEENVDEFIKAGGNAILIPRPWNRLRRDKVIPHLENAITSVNNLEYILGKPEEVSSHPDTGTIPDWIGSTPMDNEIKEIRTFDSGATRDTTEGKPNYVKALCPLVLRGYVDYLNKHRKQPDGSMRDFDNWKQGIPKQVYMEGLGRHEMAVWLLHQGYPAYDNHGSVTIEDSLYAIIFNATGYLHEILKGKEECQGNAQQD